MAHELRGDHLIEKPVARNNDRMPFLEACFNVLKKMPWLSGVVVTLAYVDGTVSSASVGLNREEAKRAIDAAKDALTVV
jgi:hypothetical protein